MRPSLNSNLHRTLCAGISLTLTNCTLAGSDKLQSASDKMFNVTTSAQAALAIEQKGKIRTRRYEAIEYYIQTRSIAPSQGNTIQIDFSKSDEIGSFSRFVCAGSGSLLRTEQALSYSNAYSLGIKGILAPGDDTLSGQFSRFRTLERPMEGPKVPGAPPFRFRSDLCSKSCKSHGLVEACAYHGHLR